MVESCISGLVTPPGVNADFSTRRAFNCYLAARVDYRSPRDCSRSGNGHTPADSRRAPAHADSHRRVAAADSDRTHRLTYGAVHPRRLCGFLSGRDKPGMPPFNDDGNTHAKTFRRHHRSGKSLCSTSGVVSGIAVSSAHHGDVAVAACEPVARVRSRVVVNHFTSRHERALFVRRAARRRTCFCTCARTRVAFPTF